MEQMPASHKAWAQAYPDCDKGPIAKTGVAWTPISQQWSIPLMMSFWFSRPTPLRVDDCEPGYMNEPRPGAVTALNEDNEYHAAADVMTGLRMFLAGYGPWVTEQLGHPWSICSVRSFALRAHNPPGLKHTDGWPPCIRKAFLLPAGSSKLGGTTWFKLRNGTEMTFEHPDPCLMIFENSVVEHCSVPGRIYRPTIEFDIVPSREVNPTPVYAGINGWFPWEPKH